IFDAVIVQCLPLACSRRVIVIQYTIDEVSTYGRFSGDHIGLCRLYLAEWLVCIPDDILVIANPPGNQKSHKYSCYEKMDDREFEQYASPELKETFPEPGLEASPTELEAFSI